MALKVSPKRELIEERLTMFVDGRSFGGSFSASRRVSHAPDGGNRLHGHTYEIAVSLKGKAGAGQRFTFPFEQLIAIVKGLCAELNNKVILASGGANVYKEDSRSIEYMSADNKRYVLPLDDVKLLPVEEVTIEALSSWVGEQIAGRLGEYHDYYANIAEIKITLFEGRQRGCTVAVQLT